MDVCLHVPPQEAAEAARRGLELRERYGRGGTDVGVARARRLLARDPLDYREVRVVSAWFARHGARPRSGRHGWGSDVDPSAGWIAWLLWGGDAGRAWADAIVGRPPARSGDEARLLKELERLCL